MVCCICEQGFPSPNSCIVTSEMDLCINEFPKSLSSLKELTSYSDEGFSEQLCNMYFLHSPKGYMLLKGA